MIKVNLLKNRAEGTSNKAAGATSTEFNYESSYDIGTSEGTSSTKQIINKVLVIVLAVAGLMVYESYNIDSLTGQLRGLQAQNTKLTNELNEKKPIAEKAKALQKEIQELEVRIKAIKDLSKIRLREIRSVDYIQNVIPERVWLTEMSFKEESLRILGGALADDQLNRFLESLESKSYFKNVILLKSIEEKSKEGTIKRFEISATLTQSD